MQALDGSMLAASRLTTTATLRVQPSRAPASIQPGEPPFAQTEASGPR